jgi:dihydropteroate synthase
VIYYRPLVQQGRARPDGACVLAGGPLWFTHVEALSRAAPTGIFAARDIPPAALDRLSAVRAPVAGLDMGQPQIMGILNVTPDSFSDGGRHNTPDEAIKVALGMVGQGAGIIDIGGESTRPGAALVSDSEEIDRTAPVIAGLRERVDAPLSIDTRKAAVAREAIKAGAGLINDVSGFTYDPALAPLAAQSGLPVCVMHAQGDPATMQQAPHYDNVLLDVYDFLETQVTALERAGIGRDQVAVDPGIGFGKTTVHNLALLRNIALFHGLGCAILLGASRKRFIGEIGNGPLADARAPGSIAVGLAALGQGVQILRVHDVAETAQAIRLWQAVRDEGNDA